MTSNKRGNPGSSGMKEHQQCKTSGYLWGTIFPCKLFRTCEALKSWSYNSVWRNFQCVRVCARVRVCVCACARSARDCSMTWRAVRGAKQRDRRGRRAPALPVKWHDTTSKQTMHPRSCALQTAKIIRKRTAHRRLNKLNRAKMQLNILNYNA